MHFLTFEMRRNKKIFMVLIALCVMVYFFIYRSSTPKRRYIPVKNGHRASFYRQNLTSNSTFRQPFINHQFHLPSSKEAIETYLKGEQPRFEFKPEVLKTETDFNINKDVIVYLHIQKAGGTVFNEHLMKDLILEKPCNCTKEMITNPCLCKTRGGHVWLFSWFSVGWPCGLHADWTMLHECVAESLDKTEGKNPDRR